MFWGRKGKNGQNTFFFEKRFTKWVNFAQKRKTGTNKGERERELIPKVRSSCM
jgi:hypothetical protein